VRLAAKSRERIVRLPPGTRFLYSPDRASTLCVGRVTFYRGAFTLKFNFKHCLFIAAAVMAVSLPLIAQDKPKDGDAKDKAPAAAAATKPVDPNKVVLQIGDDKMTAAQFEEFVADLPPQVQAMAKGPAKRMLADEIVRYKLLAAEARKRGIDQTPKFKRQMKIVEDQMLASMLSTEVQNAVADKDLQIYLDAHKPDYETAKARHILVRFKGSRVPAEAGKAELSEDEAKAKAMELRKKIESGTDFATVAKVDSDDKASGAQGGDLGTFTRDQMVKPFADAAFAMKPGEISQPVRSDFGYHIIQLQEKSTPDVAKLKEELTAKVAPLKLEDMTGKLKTDVKPMVDDSFFGPPAPVPGAFPPGGPAAEASPAPEAAPAGGAAPAEEKAPAPESKK
jgi:peptidyl-prolyl cis-trans isomerase C